MIRGLNFSVIRFTGAGGIANSKGGCEIDDNQFFDCPSTNDAIEFGYADVSLVWAGNIRRNSIDMDPFFRNPNHAGDTWSSATGSPGILLNNVIVSGKLSGNQFRNTARIIDYPANIMIQPLSNYAYFAPVRTSGVDGQATNKGSASFTRLQHWLACSLMVTQPALPS